MLLNEALCLIRRSECDGLIAHHAVDIVTIDIVRLGRINQSGVRRLLPLRLAHVVNEKADEPPCVFRLQGKRKCVAAGTELHRFAFGTFDEDLSLRAGVVRNHHAAHFAAVVGIESNRLDGLRLLL